MKVANRKDAQWWGRGSHNIPQRLTHASNLIHNFKDVPYRIARAISPDTSKGHTSLDIFRSKGAKTPLDLFDWPEMWKQSRSGAQSATSATTLYNKKVLNERKTKSQTFKLNTNHEFICSASMHMYAHTQIPEMSCRATLPLRNSVEHLDTFNLYVQLSTRR